MSGAANQRIVLDGEILKSQVTTLREASSTFSTVSGAVDAPLSGDAFGLLSQGILVPAVQALAGRSRELLNSARELTDKMADGAETALKAFSALEEDAVDAFNKGDESLAAPQRSPERSAAAAGRAAFPHPAPEATRARRSPASRDSCCSTSSR